LIKKTLGSSGGNDSSANYNLEDVQINDIKLRKDGISPLLSNNEGNMERNGGRQGGGMRSSKKELDGSDLLQSSSIRTTESKSINIARGLEKKGSEGDDIAMDRILKDSEEGAKARRNVR
jgi:hypothetical protein